MLKKFTTLAAIILVCVAARPAPAATLSPTLQKQLATLSDAADAGLVIVSFKTDSGLRSAHLDVLRGLGILKGVTMERLGMVAVPATAGQVRALASRPEVRSVWSNDRLHYYDVQARTLTGVDRARADRGFQTRNAGLPVSGQGDFSVLVIDSGIDATHEDLKFGRTVVQNVQVLTSTNLVGDGFTPLVTLENVPNTDQSVGHGTHCAGIIAGSGQRSGGKYAGVAPGAKLIGAGLGAGLFVLNAVGAWEWALANQHIYNIRVVSNSYGSFDTFDPTNPIHVASKMAYDNGIVVVFAGANSGPGKNTYNQYAKAPWVIGVAAGTKEGGLASFSSRGLPAEERLADDDPLNDFDAPVITAPGAGREFESNAAKFTAAYIATRSITNLVANGTTDDAEIEPGYVPFYTQIVGTSMATPYVAGVVALMLDADPTLTPDEVRQIITETATRMPGYADYEVGAGYVNAYAAVDKVFNRAKNYNTFNQPTFNAQFAVSSGAAPMAFTIDFDPTATPGANSPNARKFNVAAGMSVLDVQATADTALGEGTGNVVGIILTAPNGATYSSGIKLPVLDAPTLGITVENPAAGEWVLEVRGARGLAAVPGVSVPTSGAAAPGPVDVKISQRRFDLAPVADIENHASRAEIELAIKSRRIDTQADGLFHPDAAVTREDFARTLLLNVPVRQSLGASAKFTDVSGSLAALAEALTTNGSTLRDWNFAPAGVMSAGATFNPAGAISRLDLAVAFVRALGLDTEARNLAGSNVNVSGVIVADNAQIPAGLRGYVQIAIDKGFLEVYPAEVKQTALGQFQVLPGPRVEPSGTVTRAALAAKANAFAARFAAGN